MTPTEKIFQVLIEHLGQADAIRFLQYFHSGKGDLRLREVKTFNLLQGKILGMI